jgi:hypothetical protein
MFDQMEAITKPISQTISWRKSSRKAIMAEYDRVFAAITATGFTDFVAHTWTVITLSSIFGDKKVKWALDGPLR